MRERAAWLNQKPKPRPSVRPEGRPSVKPCTQPSLIKGIQGCSSPSAHEPSTFNLQTTPHSALVPCAVHPSDLLQIRAPPVASPGQPLASLVASLCTHETLDFIGLARRHGSRGLASVKLAPMGLCPPPGRSMSRTRPLHPDCSSSRLVKQSQQKTEGTEVFSGWGTLYRLHRRWSKTYFDAFFFLFQAYFPLDKPC